MSDRFESEYMAGDDAVRHRDKRVSRGMAAALGVPAVFTTGLAVFVAFANASAPKPVPAAALPFVVAGLLAFAALFVVLSLSFAVLRTVVTDEELMVRYGLWGPTIRLASITSCRVTDYDWTEFGGWGIRIGKGGVKAYVPGPGQVVEVVYDDGGDERRVLIGAKDAAALATQIDRARGTAGVRFDTDDVDVSGEEDAAAEEVAASEEAAAAAKRAAARRADRRA